MGNIIDFSCLVVNPIISRLFDSNSDDLIGKSVIKNFLTKVSPNLFPALVNVVETGKSLEQDISINDKESLKWYHLIAVKLGDGFAITLQDITQQKNLQFNLEQTNKELEAFSYSVAHDLRNPLGIIKTLTDVLENKSKNHSSQDTDKLLNLIGKSTIQMQNIIEDLLTLSNIKYAKKTVELVDLNDIVKEIINRFQTNEPQRKLEVIISPKVIAKVDKRLLKIALENLIGNAWKYSSKKDITCIEFGVLLPDIQGWDSIIQQCSLFYKDKSYCQQKLEQIYFIKDNGAGFDMEKAKELFSPFKRFHSNAEFKGTGIGLSIVQRIIHRHNGLIWVNSQVEVGTTFYFTLNN